MCVCRGDCNQVLERPGRVYAQRPVTLLVTSILYATYRLEVMHIYQVMACTKLVYTKQP